MKKISTFMFLLLSHLLMSPMAWSACAVSGDWADNPVKAQYSIMQSDKSHSASEQKPMDLILWRYKNQVAHQYPQRQISEVWYQQKNHQIKLTRHFDVKQKGIEYQAGEINHQDKADWGVKSHLISKLLFSQLNLNRQVQGECDTVHYYSGTQEGKTVELRWLAGQKLIQYLHISGQQTSQTWQLVRSSHHLQTIAGQFNRWDNYHTTDYADIGDNESDPFLAQMIHQGFVGH